MVSEGKRHLILRGGIPIRDNHEPCLMIKACLILSVGQGLESNQAATRSTFLILSCSVNIPLFSALGRPSCSCNE